MATVVTGDSSRLTPAATAETVSCRSSPVCARWVATRDEEQAVSVLTHGPARQQAGHFVWSTEYSS